MPLCPDCTSSSLSAPLQVVKSSDIIESRSRTKTSNEHSIQQLNLSSLRQSATNCDLCALFLKLVEFQDALLPKIDPVEVQCHIYLKDYGDILCQKPESTGDPEENLVYGSKAVESVPRLALTAEWAGNQRAILPCGLQLKAPGSLVIDKSTALRGRVVGEQIDLQRVLEWRKICSDTHGSVCTPPQIRDETSELTIRVIDVEQLYIVNLPKDCEYVVLSYVWGKTAQLRLLRKNYENLTQPFALLALLDTLPRTIVDATTLVRQLGERFLWVDSLCIIQDSPEDLAVQIQHMNTVYGCASLTIVAAAGSDSDAGLPGLRPNSRKILDIDQEIEGISVITALPSFADSIVDSVWESRGWTMQEKVLSKHLLIFTEYQIFYHCNKATWCEDAIWEYETPLIQLQGGLGTMSPDLARCALPHPNLTGLGKYAHLVSGYHGRQLSYENDALNAFTGALTALGKDLNTSFIYGLPKSAFDQTILWRSPIQNEGFRREQFPSWSWLGWKAGELPGDIEFPVGSKASVETIPLVQWHQITPEGDQKLIGNHPAEYYELPKLESLPSLGLYADHILRFWAHTVHLFVEREPLPAPGTFTRYGCYLYAFGIRDVDNELRILGRISLRRDWRNSRPDDLEFILLCRRKTRNLFKKEELVEGLELMLIETVGDVSYRVQLPDPIHPSWLGWIKEEWRIVNLG